MEVSTPISKRRKLNESFCSISDYDISGITIESEGIGYESIDLSQNPSIEFGGDEDGEFISILSASVNSETQNQQADGESDEEKLEDANGK